jgi:hypothetical protein
MAIKRAISSSVQSGLPSFDSVWDGVSAVGSMEAISSVTLSAAQSSIEFNNIPQTYTHLQIRCYVSNSSGLYWIITTINNDTGANYAYHNITGDGATLSVEGISLTSAGASTMLQTNGYFTTGIIDIVDYSSTTKKKVLKTAFSYDASGSGRAGISSILWNNTNAITSIRLNSYVGNLVQYSTVSLYGIK